MKRAVGEEKKELRREMILDQAASLLLIKDFESLTLSEVASGLGLVKGTLYRYFPTKESLVLEVLERELKHWLEGVGEDLAQGPAHSPGSLAPVLARSLAKRPLLVGLFSIVHVILEKNLTYERMMAFKLKTAQALNSASQALEMVCSALKGKGRQGVLALYELAIGIGHLTSRSPMVEKALETPGLEVFRLDFFTELEKTFKWTLLGLAQSPE